MLREAGGQTKARRERKAGSTCSLAKGSQHPTEVQCKGFLDRVVGTRCIEASVPGLTCLNSHEISVENAGQRLECAEEAVQSVAKPSVLVGPLTPIGRISFVAGAIDQPSSLSLG
jgi:hypothetical protein